MSDRQEQIGRTLRRQTTGDRPYQVIGDQFVGNGATPGLALRDFWRSIEDAALAGRLAPTHYLPQRRRWSLSRRAALKEADE